MNKIKNNNANVCKLKDAAFKKKQHLQNDQNALKYKASRKYQKRSLKKKKTFNLKK